MWNPPWRELMTPWASKNPYSSTNGGRWGRLFAFALLALTFAGCRRHDFPQYAPNYREYAYITNGSSNTVTVLDVVNVRLDREIPVGPNPVAVAVSPTRHEAYVVNSGTAGNLGYVSIINA